MTPNFCAPVDRSAEAMQGIGYHGDIQAYGGGVSASGFKCTLCMATCSALASTPRAVCEAACKATVCQ